jgi:hypothetical protein
MKLCILVPALLLAGSAFGETVSYTGTLNSPKETWQTDATLSSAGTLTLQTWGFGGGTNAAGTVILSGGFDPFVGVFDSSGNLIQGTSDVLTNFTSFTGCPPAGLVTIGSVPDNCGDITMSLAPAVLRRRTPGQPLRRGTRLPDVKLIKRKALHQPPATPAILRSRSFAKYWACPSSMACRTRPATNSGLSPSA